jgi:DNA-binding MarR family transcriptional regulator
MNANQQSFRGLAELITRVMDRWAVFGSLPRTYGTGCRIYPAEIHLIDRIGRAPGINVTRLAASLEVTKGAVSQAVGKLVKKGLVDKTEGAGSAREVCLGLTSRGRVAFRNNERFYQMAYRLFLTRYGRRAPAQMAVYRELFAEFGAFFAEFARRCPNDLPAPRGAGRRTDALRTRGVRLA